MDGIQTVWIYAHNIIRSARQLVNVELRKLGLNSAEGNILLHLLTQGDGVRQEAIVGELDISKPAVSRALNSLQSKGYLVRERDPLDGRASRVLLLDPAKAMRKDLIRIYDQVFSTAAQGLSAEEVATLAQQLGRVSDNFTRAIRKKGRS